MEAGRERSVPRLMKVQRVVNMWRPELPMERLRVLRSRYVTTYVFILMLTLSRAGLDTGHAQHGKELNGGPLSPGKASSPVSPSAAYSTQEVPSLATTLETA